MDEQLAFYRFALHGVGSKRVLQDTFLRADILEDDVAIAVDVGILGDAKLLAVHILVSVFGLVCGREYHVVFVFVSGDFNGWWKVDSFGWQAASDCGAE